MMTDEEMRRTMEFILQQQAQFAASIQRLEEERARDQPRLKRLEDSFLILVQLEKLDAWLWVFQKMLDTCGGAQQSFSDEVNI